MSKKQKAIFKKKEYLAAVAEYDSQWNLLDETLYSLCREHPENSSPLSVFAKVFCIGRSYQSQTGLQIKVRGAKKNAITQIAECLLRHGEQIDNWIRSLSGQLDLADLVSIVDTHGRLLNLLKPISKQMRSPRSFVSNYLHFHVPAVPIYSRSAERSLEGFVPWNETLNSFERPKMGEREYDRFVKRFLRLCSIVEKEELIVSVRRLDHYLVRTADRSALPLSP